MAYLSISPTLTTPASPPSDPETEVPSQFAASGKLQALILLSKWSPDWQDWAKNLSWTQVRNDSQFPGLGTSTPPWLHGAKKNKIGIISNN